MSSLEALVAERTDLSEAALERLQAVVADWQLLADLSFADLLLFCRAADSPDEVLVVAQMRPHTAQTSYRQDLVGRRFGADERGPVLRALDEAVIVPTGEPGGPPAPPSSQAVPVVLDGRAIAVVTREANPPAERSLSELELTYLEIAADLSAMLAEGTFPTAREHADRELAPRVGDGLMRLDAAGGVVYASPNAVSAHRRLGVAGHLVGRNIAELEPDGSAVRRALAQRRPLESEVEASGTVVLRRLIPLLRGGRLLGGVVLLREVTELRRHERMLLSKDVTIREIHHRVKNNLQTVASLLRLQMRRLDTGEATQALAESVRRISSIALVHETLAEASQQRVAFDAVAERLVGMVGAGLTDPDRAVAVSRTGAAGELPAAVATPLALVLSELLQNAVEHGFPDRAGRVAVHVERDGDRVRLEVVDDGVGLPPGWSVQQDANLGLQIASTLVEDELAGSLQIGRVDGGPGTRCVVELTIGRGVQEA